MLERDEISSVPQATRYLAERFGSLTALQDEGSSFTYQELDSLTDSVAVSLRSLDVAAGDVVLWVAENCAAFVVAYLATAKANLRFMPMNVRLSAAEMSQVVDLVKPKIVLCAEAYHEAIDGVLSRGSASDPQVMDADEWIRAARNTDVGEHRDDSRRGFGVNGDTPHEILLTSGTTGQVKAVERCQGSRIAESLAAIASWPTDVRMHQLRMTPQFHMGGIAGPYQTLLSGGLVTVGKFSIEMAAKWIAAGANFLAGVPSQYSLLINSGVLDGVSTDHVLICSVGGSGSSAEEIKRLQAAFSRAHLLQIYGSTEAGLISMSSELTTTEHLSSVGRALPGVSIRLVDSKGDQVSTGQVGEVQVRSPFLMKRYFKRPDLTEAAFTSDGFFLMGDLAHQDAEGRLAIVGRSKDVIISGGENIYPKEVEDVLLQIDGVREAAVVAQKHPILQEMLTAVICMTADRSPESMDHLGTYLADSVRSSLAGYKVPREIYIANHIPRNAMGKVNRSELLELLPSLTRVYSR